MSDYEQIEIIADNYSKIGNDYDPIDPKQIQLDRGNQKPAPVFEAHEVFEYQTKIWSEHIPGNPPAFEINNK